MDVKSSTGLLYLAALGNANGASPTGLTSAAAANIDLSQIKRPTDTLPVTEEAKSAVVGRPGLITESIPISPISVTPEPSKPSTIVTLGQMPELSPTYEELVMVNLLRDKSPTGPAGTAVSQALMQSFNQLNDQKTTFTPSNLLSKVGALSRETSVYRNEVRRFSVPQNIALDKFSPDFSKSVGTRAETVTLNIKTKEGDNIQIQVSRNTSGKDTSQLEFSFTVDGELSEQEQLALEKLATKLGEMGDEFFRAGSTELRGLKDIDTDVISHFSFSLQRFDPATNKYLEQKYEFNVDDVAQTQELVAVDVNNYKVEIKTGLQSIAQENVLEHELLQQYLDLIRKSSDESHTPNASKRFMVDAFRSMFSGFIATGEPGVEGAAEQTADAKTPEAALRAFDTGMPDFKATFRSPVVHNPGFYTQTSAMVLTIEQQTTAEKNGDELLVKQESRYELKNNHFGFAAAAAVGDLGGNYTYTTDYEQGTTSRILSATNDEVNNLWIEQDITKEVEKNQFMHYKLVDQDNRSYEDRKVRDFAELLEKLHDNNQRLGVEELLNSSKNQLFMRYS